MLHGRAEELAAIDKLLAGAHQQRSGALALHGDAGIGKSALLDYAAEHAEGMRVLRAAGVESEAELAFAALHQLLLPLQEGIDRLPAPQAAALRSAFGLASAPADGPDRFLIAVAALTLLADAAEQRPILCTVDDAQWMDSPSADALLFVVRRLAAEGIVVLFAVRAGEGRAFTAAGIPERHLTALDADAAVKMLADRHAPHIAEEVLGDLVARTGGNPLALLEVAPLLDAAQRAGLAPLPEALPIGAGLERAFLTRVRRLPPDTQALLEVAAVEDSGDMAVVLPVAAGFGAGAESLAAAEDSGLVRAVEGGVVFRHPLIRSAVYRGMPSARRRAVHRALADAQGHAADRRAWHLAAAASGPDDDAAAALEFSADRARTRSGHAAAATALVRAAELSTDDRVRARRLVSAAGSAWLAGQAKRARMLVDRATPIATAIADRAAIAHLRGQFQLRAGVPGDAADILVDGADLVADQDPGLALEMFMTAVDAAHHAGEPIRVVDIARRARAIPAQRDERARFAAYYLDGMSRVLQRDMNGGVPLLDAADALADEFDDPVHLLYAAATGLYSGRGDTRQFVPRAVARARTLGAVGDLPHALVYAALGAATAGYLGQAVSQATEGLEVARDTGQDTLACALHAALAKAAALGGDEDGCRAHAHEARTVAVPRRLGLAVALADEALGLLDLGLGRPHEALTRFQSIARAAPGAGHPFVAMTTATYLVEAAVRAGRRDIAEAVTAAYVAEAQHAATGHRAMAAYCQGLVGDSAGAGDAHADGQHTAEHFEEALRLLTAPMPFWRARIELSYGEHLRRSRQRSRARGHLRSAWETFDGLGITPWAERAQAELRATGETARKRTIDTVDHLTPQELQIAELVSDGASNPDIAAQLFLSRRTVEYHLRKVYVKLGISARHELAQLGRPSRDRGGLGVLTCRP